mmetsp:Transcript_13883/g.39623  ORF Transcript_13883/g.39623 Transcript_13883/m.39623 type:complete len:405 (-) Transcript_13883:309-1523(-)
MGCRASQPNASDVPPVPPSPASAGGGQILLGSQPSSEFAKKQVRIQADGGETESPLAARRSVARKSTPWVKLGDAPIVDAEDDEEGDGQKHVTIAPAPKRQANSSGAGRRSGARKGTPWVKPGDAKPMFVSDDDGDSAEDADKGGANARRVTIDEDASRSAAGASEEVKRSQKRKSTPFVRPGASPVAAEEEEQEEEDDEQCGRGDGSRAQRRVVISEAATRHKEEAERGRDQAEQAEVRRSRQRKCTPFLKPGDADGIVDQDDEDLSGESPSKRVVINLAASQIHEIAGRQEESEESPVEARRTRQRKGTPFVKPGAALVALEDEEDEDEFDDGAAVGAKHVRICGDEDEPVKVERSKLRKGTPWVRPGDAAKVQLDDEEQIAGPFGLCRSCLCVQTHVEPIG